MRFEIVLQRISLLSQEFSDLLDRIEKSDLSSGCKEYSEASHQSIFPPKVLDCSIPATARCPYASQGSDRCQYPCRLSSHNHVHGLNCQHKQIELPLFLNRHVSHDGCSAGACSHIRSRTDCRSCLKKRIDYIFEFDHPLFLTLSQFPEDKHPFAISQIWLEYWCSRRPDKCS